MERDSRSLVMVIDMKDSISKENHMVKGFTNGPKEDTISVLLLMAWDKAKANGSMFLGTFMKGLSRMISNMDKVFKYLRRDNDLKEFLMKECNKKVGFMEQTVA